MQASIWSAIGRLLRRVGFALLGLAVLAGICAIDAYYFEPYYPRVIRQNVYIKDLPEALDGLKIVHLSDLHIVRLGKREERALRAIKRVNPDLICLTGDYVDDDGVTPGRYTQDECVANAARFVSRLSSRRGTYAVLGNWDFPKTVVPALRRSGAHMLGRDSEVVRFGDSQLRIASAESVEREARISSRTSLPTLVLDHFPYSADTLVRIPTRIDLIMAGHWHGGQVGWPMDRSDMEYVAGLFHVGKSQLYVTRGLGVHTMAVRFNCPSEITLIVLKRG